MGISRWIWRQSSDHGKDLICPRSGQISSLRVCYVHFSPGSRDFSTSRRPFQQPGVTNVKSGGSCSTGLEPVSDRPSLTPDCPQAKDHPARLRPSWVERCLRVLLQHSRMRRQDGSQGMTVKCRELNMAMPPVHAAMLNSALLQK